VAGNQGAGPGGGTGITPDEIERVYATIQPYVRRTPVLAVEPGDLGGELAGGPAPAGLWLKLEQLQCAGSFKARGAFTNLLLRDLPAAGVAAASGGNHGVAVAYAAHRLGVPAKVFVPSISSPAKIARIRGLGADLVVTGDRYANALAAAEEYIAGSGALSVHAFDQRETLLGQGTVGLELAQQVEPLDTVLVPVGGGGLIGGIAAYLTKEVRVVGVEPDGAPTLFQARAAGRPVDAPAEGLAADALAPKRIGELVFPITQDHVDEVVLVGDDAIRAARARLWQAFRIAAEPAASVGVAALMTGAYRPGPDEHVAVVISGANLTLPELDREG
jgi:threonine dehydratase